MKLPLIAFFALLPHALAHGDSHGSKSTDLGAEVPEGITWEQWHMKQEHNLDEYEPQVFFELHDSKGKGYLDEFDILNAYGLARDEVIGSGDGLGSHDDSEIIDQHTKNRIVKKITRLVDANEDHKITREEYMKFASNGGQFPDLNVGVGHHGDFEHEYEVHHWIKYHRDDDPDIKVIHKEDIEHELLHHEHEIEHEINEDENEKNAFISDEILDSRINYEKIPLKFKLQN